VPNKFFHSSVGCSGWQCAGFCWPFGFRSFLSLTSWRLNPFLCPPFVRFFLSWAGLHFLSLQALLCVICFSVSFALLFLLGWPFFQLAFPSLSFFSNVSLAFETFKLPRSLLLCALSTYDCGGSLMVLPPIFFFLSCLPHPPPLLVRRLFPYTVFFT